MGHGGAPGAATPENPEDIYRGRAGYHRMLNEIRESLYAEMPEMRGSVEIFDHLADPDQEIRRIARSFDMSVKDLQKALGYDNYDKFKQDLNGHSLSTTLPDGRFIAIAAAWDPDNQGKDPDDMTFEDIHRYARIIVHETMHGLDPRIRADEKLGPNGWIIGSHANSRSAEMFADIGAQDLMLRNGDTPVSTFNLMVTYDGEAPFAAPFSHRLFDSTNTRYDNGPFMQQLLNDYQGDRAGEGLQDFRFHGWRQTVEKVGTMRSSGNPELSIDSTLRNYAQTPAFQEIYRSKITELETRLQPIKNAILEQTGFENLHDFLEYYMDDMNFRGWHDGSVNRADLPAELTTALQAVYDAKIELGVWMEQNRDRFHDAARVAEATRYLTGQQDQYISVAAPSTHDLTNDMLMARNWAHFHETGEELYLRAATDYGESSELSEYQAYEKSGSQEEYDDFSRREIMSQLFASHPELVQAVAQGVPLHEVVNVDRVDPDNLNDDKYTVVENFDEVVARYAQPPVGTEPHAPAAQEHSLQAPVKP
ncbi:MAG: hypothetical protein H6858_05490 [Rhodospirillales bacterium]|nr:hypothetical protein [Alphaproteobacteria bacterium]MCB9977028.1 hypothetical protein [Rhodospirillales bacterium]